MVRKVSRRVDVIEVCDTERLLCVEKEVVVEWCAERYREWRFDLLKERSIPRYIS